MKHKDFESHPERTVSKLTIAAAGTYYPDLNIASVHRWDCSSYDTTVGTPKNPRDGQYMRLEFVSAENMDIQFTTAIHVNGAVIADDTHEDNVLLILEGWYNSTTAVWNMTVLSVKAA